MGYQPQLLEPKWQAFWEEHKTFKAEIDHSKEKLYVLDMFPYPSGDGLHVGHVEGYTVTDIYSRYKRLRNFNVLHVIGWDAFGLPAEQYAIKTNQHPAITTSRNIANFKRQIKALGFSYDWDREISTCDADYFRWTQWIFLKIYHQQLAYQDMALVNWCPQLKAVLANEEVVDGLSEIGGHPVVRKPLRQWMLKITAYANRLLDGLAELNWPKSILEMQRNWIGKSKGANCLFRVADSKHSFMIYTTRPDTLFGATYCVLAPEHPLVLKITSADQKAALEHYLAETSRLSDRERISEGRPKTGVFTGSYAINPVNQARLPIWVANYVLTSYGTGAIMAVPAHDQRDYEFAQIYQLNIIKVLDSKEEFFSGEGKLINSGEFTGLDSRVARAKIVDFLAANQLGEHTVNYRLRDWIFSRQRYWGEPIPIVFDQQNQPQPLSEDELPLELPEVKKYEPAGSGESPLAKVEDWVNFKKDGHLFKRETNTMPQWAGSCWYYLRFLDPHNKQAPFSKEAENYWMPVDLYVGGAEHAVLHLLYARFWHKVLYDYGYVKDQEPFKRLVNQGTILGSDGQKMSKSRGNVVSPDEIIATYGADSLRVYEMFLGPIDKSKPWQSGAIDGVYRFLSRVWNWLVDDKTDKLKTLAQKPSEPELRALHPLIKKVGDDLEQLKFNTAISAMMIFINEASRWRQTSRYTAERFVVVISPFAPHLAEELWQRLGHQNSISGQAWPDFEQQWLKVDEIMLPVQVNGKLRANLKIPCDLEQAEVLELVKAEATVAKHLAGKEIKKVIFVKNRIINLVAI